MLERLIIDISKWIVIILIFFIAFACSLFLIFSYFAVSLQQRESLMEPPQYVNPQPPLISTSSNLSTIARNSRCPAVFHELINATILEGLVSEETHWSKDRANASLCEQTSEYSRVKRIGPYPAIHYFGQSFGATVLTIFFTLFGVIAADNIPVRRHVSRQASCFCFSCSGSWLRVDHSHMQQASAEQLSS